MSEDKTYDKYQAATVQLADTIYLYLRGGNPVTILNITRAARDLLSGVHSFYHHRGVIADRNLFQESFLSRDLRLSSNAAKHAEQDPDVKDGYGPLTALLSLTETANGYIRLTDHLAQHGLIELTAPPEPKAIHPVQTKPYALAQMFSQWAVGRKEPTLDAAMERALKNIGNNHKGETPPDKKALMCFAAEAICSPHIVPNDEKSRKALLQRVQKMNLWPVEPDGGAALKETHDIRFRRRDKTIPQHELSNNIHLLFP